MSKLKLNKKSLEDMMQEVGSDLSERVQQEAKLRSPNLEFLNQEIGLPFPKPTSFKSSDLLENSKKWQDFYNERSTELCNLRLLPKKGSGVLRKRVIGKTLEEHLEWFKSDFEQHQKYDPLIVPFIVTKKWSTIFVVNKKGIFGEIISGNHTQLTQGHRDIGGGEPTSFSFDYNNLVLRPHDKGAKKHLEIILGGIKVNDVNKQDKIKERLSVEFYDGYMSGYFETVQSVDGITTWYIDHSVVLGEEYSDYSIDLKEDSSEGYLLNGMVASEGVYSGKVRIVKLDEVKTAEFDNGDILVCDMTSPDYLPLMMKSGAILTDKGGILSHASIVARELKKPCIVGVNNGTSTLNNRQLIVVDANKGVVYEG